MTVIGLKLSGFQYTNILHVITFNIVFEIHAYVNHARIRSWNQIDIHVLKTIPKHIRDEV